MRQLSSILSGLARILCPKRGREPKAEGGSEAAAEMARAAKKNEMILEKSGTVWGKRSNCFVAVWSMRGEKGVNQDYTIVWEEFGCEEDLIFCGVFDGHGSWGHHVAKQVRKALPSSLLCKWQETLASASTDTCKSIAHFEVWKEAYLRACAAVDGELRSSRGLDSFNSGTTALTIIKQGELMVIANVGDSRAVLATRADDGHLVPIQLTVDLKPNLQQEVERITRCNGLVFCLQDEPGVHRVWLPDGETPGLAMSRAFGDYCLKGFGLISVPEVSQRRITCGDQFVVLATDGVWDVVSNQEAVEIVYSTKDRCKSAKRLVKYAVRAWKHKRRGVAVDDCSAICLFFDSCRPPPPCVEAAQRV